MYKSVQILHMKKDMLVFYYFSDTNASAPSNSSAPSLTSISKPVSLADMSDAILRHTTPWACECFHRALIFHLGANLLFSTQTLGEVTCKFE